MADLDRKQVCGHGYEPDGCPLCEAPARAGADPGHEVFDPQMWVAAYTASRRAPPDVPAELVGVPLN